MRLLKKLKYEIIYIFNINFFWLFIRIYLGNFYVWYYTLARKDYKMLITILGVCMLVAVLSMWIYKSGYNEGWSDYHNYWIKLDSSDEDDK